MDKQQLLARLKDIHAPDAISVWPATFTWYALFTIILAILFYAVIKLLQANINKQRKKQILTVLDQIVLSYPNNPATALANLSILLRRIALSKYKRVDVAKLHNEDWLNFLDRETQTTDFSNGIGRVLLAGPYQKSVNVNIHALAMLVERWIARV